MQSGGSGQKAIQWRPGYWLPPIYSGNARWLSVHISLHFAIYTEGINCKCGNTHICAFQSLVNLIEFCENYNHDTTKKTALDQRKQFLKKIILSTSVKMVHMKNVTP